MYQAIPPGIEIYFCPKLSFGLGISIWPLVTWVNTLYKGNSLKDRIHLFIFFWGGGGESGDARRVTDIIISRSVLRESLHYSFIQNKLIPGG